MENVLVVGANGTTGKKIVNLLKDSNQYEPIAMVREKSQQKQFDDHNIKSVLGDLEKDVSHTVNGADKIIFAAGSGGKKVIEVDQEGAKKMIDAGKAANLKKFVMLSSIGADQPEEATKLKDYLNAKHIADEYLRASLLPYSIVRPGPLNNNAGTGKIKAGKSIENTGEISRDDVAKTLVAALSNEIAYDTHFEILNGDQFIDEAVKNIN